MTKQRAYDGKVPIYARITINYGGGSKEISTGVWTAPECWDTANKIVIAKKNEPKAVAKALNEQLSRVTTSLEDYFKLIIIDCPKVTAAMLKDAYENGQKPNTEAKEKGIVNSQVHGDTKAPTQERPKAEHTLIGTINHFIQKFKKMVDNGLRSKETLKHWRSTRAKYLEFISFTYGTKNLKLSEIRPSLANTFLEYMTIKAPVKLIEPTAMKQIKKTKQILEHAVSLEWLDKNPLSKFKCKGDSPEVEPLELPEVLAIYRKNGLIKRLEEVRDVFVFQCFTGFAFQDLYNLSPENIVEVGIQRERWIIKRRGKTEVSEMVPILPIVEKLIEKYKDHPKCVIKNRLMPVDSNSNYNGYLKELAVICGIEREGIILDTHLARHTFADMMLNMGVPLEDVSKMLGHKSIRTTQRYCRVKKHRISKNMGAVRYSLFTKNGEFRKILEFKKAS